jgi:hypothetical protein
MVCASTGATTCGCEPRATLCGSATALTADVALLSPICSGFCLNPGEVCLDVGGVAIAGGAPPAGCLCVIPCESTAFPTCNGACPVGGECMGVTGMGGDTCACFF